VARRDETLATVAVPQLFAPEDLTDKPSALTEADVLALLQERYGRRAGNGPRWAFVRHVRDRAGFDSTATLDAVAMDTWLSGGLLLHGFEIKVSRSDWRRELAQPWKAAPWLSRLDLFSVVAPPGVVRLDELPERWGLIEARPSRIATVAKAQRLEPLPLDRSFVAALLRAACHRTPDLPPDAF